MTPPISPPAERLQVSFAQRLADFGDQVAITSVDEVVTYAQLAHRVDQAAAILGSRRRLIVQVAQNTTASLVWYLAALRSNNPLILIPDGTVDELARICDTYNPDVTIDAEAKLRSRREYSAHDLHPDLALMLSTSGSTGSPKLVRLSHRNLEANAAAIAQYLQIRTSDRAATTMPMGYCYGLSVINSHLAVGAGLVLTGLSVVDECFWQLFRQAEATTFAAVPYTFDLLERVGFSGMDLPNLRYVTQAGGRLAPERVRDLAQLGVRNGWDLYVMYGQTEATARMAYLPPDLASEYPQAIGVAIPGGELSLAPTKDAPADGVGELVYSGANVMLGYATKSADLAQGAVISSLRTGDLARRNAAGLFEVVGRCGQFAKLFGKRIDLVQLEHRLASQAIDATCFALIPAADSGVDQERLVAAITTGSAPQNEISQVRAAVADIAHVPAGTVQVLVLPELPRLASGKLDLPALKLEAIRAQTSGSSCDVTPSVPPQSRDQIRELLISAFAATLGRTDVSGASSFVSLCGDSMSYIELSVVVEGILGGLPVSWHVTSIDDLASRAVVDPDLGGNAPRRIRWTQQIETNVLLRALAVFLVVGSHVTLFDFRGGAHLLIGIAGFNFARFHLGNPDRVSRLRAMAVSLRRIIVPSMLWMALAVLIDSQYSFANVFFLHNVAMPDAQNAAWRYWFVEALVYVLIFSVAILAIPALHRAEQRWPFGFVLGVLAFALIFRYGLIEPATGPKAIYTPALVLFVFVLGWAIAKARTWPQRVLILGLVAITMPGYSDNPTRVAVVIAGLALLLLLPTVRVPAVVGKAAALVAGASLYIYLTHWQIYPLFGEAKLLALVGSMAFGVGLWLAVTRSARVTSSVTSRSAATWGKMVQCLPIRPTPRSGDSCANKRWSLRPSS